MWLARQIDESTVRTWSERQLKAMFHFLKLELETPTAVILKSTLHTMYSKETAGTILFISTTSYITDCLTNPQP